MKKMLLITLLTMLSTTAYAERKATIEDAYRDMKVYGDAIKAATANATPEQLQYDWDTYVNPSKSSNKLQTIRVEGAQALGVWSKSYAQCPTNYKLTGGGYLLTTFNGGHGYNAPNGSFADTNNNRWVVERGGMPENRGFKAYAVCMRN